MGVGIDFNLVEILTQNMSFVLAGTKIRMPLWELGIVLGILTVMIATIFSSISYYNPRASIWGESILRIVVTGPIIEEIMFRLVLISLFSIVFDSILIAIIISALLFASIYIWQGGMQVIAKIIIGIIWGIAFVNFGILVVIIAHMTHNSIAVIW